MKRLQDKVVIVTGAAGGMGAAEARLFAEEGAKVMATDIDHSRLQEWVEKAKLGGLHMEWMNHDVRSESDWIKVVNRTLSAFGRIDVLVNNAGVYPGYATTEATSLEAWENIMAINLTGPFIGSRLCIPHLKQGGGGSIIHISSIAGMVGGNGPAYSASKGGLRLLMKDQAVELAPFHIRVNAIHPGGVLTPMTEQIMETDSGREMMKTLCPMGRIGTAMEVAYGALYLASNESSYVTGEELVIDGGLVAR